MKEFVLETREGFAQMMQNLFDYANVNDHQVAMLMSVSDRTVKRWREGYSQPSPSELIKLFRLLNVPIVPFISDNSHDGDDKECVQNYIDTTATESELRDMRFNLTVKHGSSVSSQLALVSMLNHMKLVYRLMVAKTVIMLWEIASKSDGLQYTDQYMPNAQKVYDAVVKSTIALQEGRNSYTDI